VQITTHWVGNEPTATLHAYTLTFSDNGTYSVDIDMLQERNGTALATSHNLAWDSMDGVRTALLTFDTSLAWGDVIDLTVTITDHDGTSGLDIATQRTFTVGQWNQPMDDHEVLLSTSWAMSQNYTTEAGEQAFDLSFTGQGWQERVGTTLSSWELGNGTFRTVETTEDGTTDMDLVLTQLWKNETVVAGLLTSQVFDARGFGNLQTTVIDGDMVTVIDAKGAAPHLDSAGDILEWMGERERVMAPKKVVLEPNHDRFKKAYWVNIHVAESLLTTTGDDQPRLSVEADREQNRITVEATSVERFELLLNDEIVDLSKEFTIVVNGKAIQEQRRRSFRDMHSRMVTRNDWDYLFPVRYVTTVPKEAEDKGSDEKAPE